MDLSFGVSWLCMVFLCICFLPQTGYYAAHGYALQTGPKPSFQVVPGESLKATHEDGMDAIRGQSFASLQGEPVFSEEFGYASGFLEEMVQSQPGLAYKRDDEGDIGQKLRSKRDKSNEALDKRSFFTKPVGFSNNVVPSTLYGNQMFVQRSDPHLHNGFAASGLLSNNLPDDGLPGGQNNVFFSVSNNNHLQSSYKQPQQSKFSADSFFNHRTAAALEASNLPYQDAIFFSKKRSSPAPISYRSKVKKRKYRPVSSPGAANRKGFHKAGPSLVQLLPKPPVLNYFIPKSNIYVPNYEGKNKRETSKSFHAYKSSLGKKSEDGAYPFTSLKEGSPESASRYFFSNPEYKEKSVLYMQNEDIFTQHKETLPRSHPSPFSAQDRFLFQNGGYKEAIKAGLLKPISEPAGSLKMLSMKTEPNNFASWPSELLSEPNLEDLTCVIWKNTKDSNPMPQRFSPSPANMYIKSKKRITRIPTFLSRTCYKPFQKRRLVSNNRILP